MVNSLVLSEITTIFPLSYSPACPLVAIALSDNLYEPCEKKVDLAIYLALKLWLNAFLSMMYAA